MILIVFDCDCTVAEVINCCCAVVDSIREVAAAYCCPVLIKPWMHSPFPVLCSLNQAASRTSLKRQGKLTRHSLFRKADARLSNVKEVLGPQPRVDKRVAWVSVVMFSVNVFRVLSGETASD